MVQINTDHAKRVAILVNRMARGYHYNEDTIFALTQVALLHDCALLDYINDEKGLPMNESKMAKHCISGEKFVQILPFHKLVKDAFYFTMSEQMERAH